jgi:two-component system, cell cycle sensor histidine kinase and response regulator CckA
MQSLGTLAGGVAHEFNNLLAGISGYTELALREQAVPEVAAQYLRNIKELSDRAAKLTSDMLAYARRPDLRRQVISMHDLVHAAAEFVTRTLKVEVEVEIPAAPPGKSLLVEAAADELRHALINLSMNARDAMRQPAPIVFRLSHVELSREKQAFPANIPAGDYVVVEVADRGCGMAPNVLAQALDPFFTTKEVGRGTGLGLPLVLRIVEAHHGHLSIETSLGKGTCVSLYLPRWIEGEHRQTRQTSFASGEVVEPEPLAGRRILVVDDEDAVRDVVRRFLEIAGHQVISAGSGAEAIDRLSRGDAVDLVILDLMMPKDDGVATFRNLRRLAPKLPVLLCTGQLVDGPAGIIDDGAVSILRKPFRMTELWYAVRQALKPVEDVN